MEVENPRGDNHPLRSKFTPFNIHQKPYKISKQYLTFEIKVTYMRIITSSSSTNMQSSSIMNLVFLPRDLHSSLQINGLKINPSDKISIPLNRHRSDVLMFESIYVNTDRFKFTGFSLPFQIQIQTPSSSSSLETETESSVLVGGIIRRKVNEFRFDDDCMWVMECNESCSCDGVRREINGGSVDVYFAGRSLEKPLLLNGLVDLKKLETGFDSIPHEDDKSTLIDNSKEFEVNPSEEYGGSEGEEVFVEEEVSWFNAGVRVGIGLGLGMCLGVGVGFGLVVRTYKTTSGTLKRFML